MTLRAGEIWGVLGANGSGKSTFLHTLAGLHPIHDGSITIMQQSLALLSRKMIAQKIGILLQDSIYRFPQTVRDFCAGARHPHLHYFQPLSATDEQHITRALDLTGLLAQQNKLITELSGGEKRRLGIATVLTQDPAIYLLDEPTNHLDPRHQINLFHHLRSLTDAVIVMSLHDINIALQLCDHVLLIFDDGSTQYGPTRNILTKQHLERLYGYDLTDAIALGMMKQLQ